MPICCEQLLDFVPNVLIDDGLMLPIKELVSVLHFSDKERVLQQLRQRTSAKRHAADVTPVRKRSDFRSDTAERKLIGQDAD